MSLASHLTVAARQAKLCLSRDMQYRLHFVGRTVSWLLWTATYIAFIEVLLAQVGSLGGWNRPQMYVLYGTYMLLDGIAQVWIQPNMHELSSLVREGRLDLLLVKPMDAQFLISTSRWDWGGLGSVLVGCTVVVIAIRAVGGFTPVGLVSYMVALAAASITLYSLWLLSVLIVFKSQRMDGIGHLFVPFFQLCRYPTGAYPPQLRIALKTVLPVAYIATVPAGLLMGIESFGQLGLCCCVAVVCLSVSRLGWRIALTNYASASS